MIRNNDDIWKAGAFNDRRDKPARICSRSRMTWRGIITVVERIEVVGRTLIVVIDAAGSDDRQPSNHDLTNAAVATLIVSKQRRFRRYRNRIRTYLQYGRSTLHQIDVDLSVIEKQVYRDYLMQQTAVDTRLPMISPLFSIVKKIRRF